MCTSSWFAVMEPTFFYDLVEVRRDGREISQKLKPAHHLGAARLTKNVLWQGFRIE